MCLIVSLILIDLLHIWMVFPLTWLMNFFTGKLQVYILQRECIQGDGNMKVLSPSLNWHCNIGYQFNHLWRLQNDSQEAIERIQLVEDRGDSLP